MKNPCFFIHSHYRKYHVPYLNPDHKNKQINSVKFHANLFCIPDNCVIILTGKNDIKCITSLNIN